MDIKCDTCKKRIKCECLKEQNIKLKYRTCALTEDYPRSLLDRECRLIHICSEKCNINNFF